MRGIMLALALFASAPTEAASCHRYARWFYPWPQRCFGQKLVSVRNVRHEAPFVSLGRGPSGPDPDIPLPSLAQADLVGGQADEPTRARVLLRAALEAADAH